MEQNLTTKKLDKNKKIILTIIVVLILCVGSTLAYIIAHLQDEARGNASVTSDAVDILKFEIDKDINLNPTQFNVVEGGDNLSDTAVGSAILRANSTDNNATYNYYVYFNIKSNNYIYTTEEQTPEIVLTILDPNDNPVTSIDGLDYVTSGGVSGFDITTKSGLYEVAELYEIISTSSSNDTIQEWKFTVSFINLDTNQAENGGKTLEAEIILSRKPTDYHKVCEEGTLACDIAKLYNEEDPSVNGLYYHNGTITSENEYCMFDGNTVLSFPDGTPSTNAEDCQNIYDFGGMYIDSSLVTIGVEMGQVEEVSWNSESGVCQTTSGIPVYTDINFNIAVTQEQCSGYAFMGDTESLIVTNVGSGTIERQTQLLDADDKSYRYSGANPNNYVCFGANVSTCPDENLYRVIGVFNGQVKLIKADYATSAELGTNGDYEGNYTEHLGTSDYYKGDLDQSSIGLFTWNDVNYDLAKEETGYGNVWSYSELNKTNLNTNFINSFDTTWQGMIAITKWKVGGMGYDAYESSFNGAHDYEINNPNSDVEITYNAKIGLMYVSDYIYAAQPEDWNTTMRGYVYEDNANPNNNWMYMGMREWTLSRYSDASNYAFYVYDGGYVNFNDVGNVYAVRPSFSLSSSVILSGGSGTADDPFRIKL